MKKYIQIVINVYVKSSRKHIKLLKAIITGILNWEYGQGEFVSKILPPKGWKLN